MIKTLLSAILIASLAWMTQFFMPWWNITLVAFLAGLAWINRPSNAFAAGALGGVLFWGGAALVRDIMNGSILSEQIGVLFGNLPGFGILLITIFLGGILGGMGSMTGALLKLQYIKK